MMEGDSLAQARIDLAGAFRLAVRFGLHEGICNHFSYQVTQDRFLINPQGLHWSEITAGALVVADHEGQVLAGDLPVEPTARFIHSRIHAALPRARCVLHTHMPYATSLTLLQEGRLLALSQTACMFYRRVAYYDEYNGLVLDEAEGDRMVECFADKDVMFLANHGVIVIGPSIAHALNDLYYLERACQLQVLAQASGKPLRLLPPAVAEKTARQFAHEAAEQVPLHFTALKRLLDQTEPDYVR